MKRSRLYTRVLVVLVALFACSTALSAAVAARSLSEMLDRQYLSKGSAIALTIAGASVDDLLIGRDLAALQALVDQYARTEGVAYILVRDAQGDAIAHTFSPEVPAGLQHTAEGNVTTTPTRIRVGSAEYLDISAPILDGELGHVHVGMDQSNIDAAFWRTIRRQAFGEGLIALAAVVAAWFLIRRITQPLSQLARHARKVASLESLFAPTRPVAEDLAPIIDRTDEVGQLARSLLHMIDALGAREQHLKWAEESIRRSERHYRSLIENVSDVIVLLDGVGKARYISPSLEGLVGFKPSEWLDRDITLLVHPDDREAFRLAVEACLSREAEGKSPRTPGEAASVEVRMVRSDGALRIIDASLTNLLFDPAVGGVAITLRDISDRKRTLELSQAREQAEEASRLKSQLLANISHEFYTPMHQILGLSDLTLQTEVNDEQRENLQLLRESAGELLGVLQNLLTFAEVEKDAVRLGEAPFGVSPLLHDVLGLLGRRAQEKGLRLDAVVAPEVPEVVVGDADRLRQVLLQVVGNGVKFTPAGEVIVRVGMQKSECRMQNEQQQTEEGASSSSALHSDFCILHFEVRDTGVGIPEDRRRAIFDPFVQADGSSTRRFGGTGLGLAVARSLVERMGGRIWLESGQEKGTTVHFTVRLREAAVQGVA
jgi:PAS domain S-box-containing protein